MWMEKDILSASMDMAGRNSGVINVTSQSPTPNSLIQCCRLNLDDQSRIVNGISMLSGTGVHGGPVSNVNVHLINPEGIDSNILISSQGKNIFGYTSLGTSSTIDNRVFQEQTAGVSSIAPASFAGILAARLGLQENLEKSQALSPSFGSLDSLGAYVTDNWPYTPNHLHSTAGDHGCNLMPHGNLDSNEWASSNFANLNTHAYASSNFSNEPVLSLATSSTTGHFSEVSCSDDVTRCFTKTRSGLGQASCSNREFGMSFNPNRHLDFSQAILGSRYLTGVQEILSQLARFSLENLEQIRYSQANSMFEAHMMEAPLQTHAAVSKKSQLLTLLELVDNRYSQFLDEIHTVVSAFHAAAELDPRVHSHFTLQTISLLYKNLRERISNYILALGPDFDNLCTEEKEPSVETSLIHKRWALQQLKRRDHQLWRPQRGLPENSVSILRAWMFQNFLHPYPKDAEKHLLALKTGLTRSQVSNWFINARVRLWKPMIEEMYAEMDHKRKASQNEGGAGSNHGSRTSFGDNKFTMR